MLGALFVFLMLPFAFVAGKKHEIFFCKKVFSVSVNTFHKLLFKYYANGVIQTANPNVGHYKPLLVLVNVCV